MTYLRLLLIACCFLFACTDSKPKTGFPQAPPSPGDDRNQSEEKETEEWKVDDEGFESRPGVWLTGDLHVHATGASNDTGGDSYPQDIAAMAEERGLDFVVLTDHSNSTGSDPTTTDEDPALFNLGPEFPYWNEVAALSAPGEFWMVSGNEVSPVAEGEMPSTPTGHIGCIPRTIEGFDQETPFTDRPKGTVSGGNALDQCLERGCFTVLNHPYAIAPWITFDWTGTGYHAMEVWNGSGGGFDEYDMHSYNAWRCDLLNGSHVTPIGASDNHRVYQSPPGELLDPALGWPSTSVLASTPTWAGIMDGLSRGHVAIHEGESRLFLDAFNDNKRLDESTFTQLRLHGELDGKAPPATLRLRRATGCTDPRPETTPVQIEETFVLEESITPGETFRFTVPIGEEPGVYTATLLTQEPVPLLGSRYGALSGAFRRE